MRPLFPAYLALQESGELDRRAEAAWARLSSCDLCPRRCGVDRRAGKLGFCGTGSRARVAAAHPHFGEEAPLVGRGGSGTIFFSSCNLLCRFCQNYEISHLNEGEEIDLDLLAALMVQLQARGCHNINLVTPTHVVPFILQGLRKAVERGLRLPLVYNCGGYESVETLRLLDGVVDIYMPDFKFWNNAWSERFCRAPDYRQRAIEAVREMHRQVGDLRVDARGIAVRGLLVRHLVMPGEVAGTSDVMRFLASDISRHTFVNVMGQYRPCGQAVGDPVIGRYPTRQEIEAARQAAREAGLTRLDRG